MRFSEEHEPKRLDVFEGGVTLTSVSLVVCGLDRDLLTFPSLPEEIASSTLQDYESPLFLKLWMEAPESGLLMCGFSLL
uniref:Uncharacterized protein n=1 Tax=Megaselia scalaris TaxID=36166 RepID=T1GU61_MEGSC